MKKIEELASEYARKKTPSDLGEYYYELNFHRNEDQFMEVAKYILSLPLADRLTDEERRELSCRYNTNKCVIADHRKRTGDKAQTRAAARIRLLENLFGIELFNEKGDKE